MSVRQNCSRRFTLISHSAQPQEVGATHTLREDCSRRSPVLPDLNRTAGEQHKDGTPRGLAPRRRRCTALVSPACLLATSPLGPRFCPTPAPDRTSLSSKGL